jgi:hypothetical protein
VLDHHYLFIIIHYYFYYFYYTYMHIQYYFYYFLFIPALDTHGTPQHHYGSGAASYEGKPGVKPRWRIKFRAGRGMVSSKAMADGVDSSYNHQSESEERERKAWSSHACSRVPVQ